MYCITSFYLQFQLLVDVNSPKRKWGPAAKKDRGDRYKKPHVTIYDNDISAKLGPIEITFDPLTETPKNGIAHIEMDNAAYDDDTTDLAGRNDIS